jgi:hypothetical protein
MLCVVNFGGTLQVSLEECGKYCNHNVLATINCNFGMLCVVDFLLTLINKNYITFQRINVAG